MVALALLLSCVFVIFESTIEAQGRGRGGTGSPPSGGPPPEWAQSDNRLISVPEPATLTLLAVGVGGMIAKAVRDRRTRKR
jgi:hypothetical protein